MKWEFYMRNAELAKFSSLGFAAEVDYQINSSPAKVFVGIYHGLNGNTQKPFINQIGHVWLQGSNYLGTSYYLFGQDGRIIGKQNGSISLGGIITVNPKDVIRLVPAGRDLATVHGNLAGFLERCIISIETAPPASTKYL